MKATVLALALVIASMVMASSACAGAEVHKCIDTGGHVMLTDEACPSDSSTVEVISAAAHSDGESGAVIVYSAAQAPNYAMPRRSRFANLNVARKPRGMALDIAMLKQARVNLHLQDNAPRTLRGHRVASLDQIDSRTAAGE